MPQEQSAHSPNAAPAAPQPPPDLPARPEGPTPPSDALLAALKRSAELRVEMSRLNDRLEALLERIAAWKVRPPPPES